MKYQPKIKPELVERGCEGGFCIPPESLTDELKCASAYEFNEVIQKSEIEELLFIKFYEYLEKTYLAVDPKIIDDGTIVLLLEQMLEIATFELICDVSVKAIKKFKQKYGEVL
jgi:hypothetical protein